ncbi:MAG TPA: putative manganese-dependent inorganic diphosphatase [Solirubrobacteraceae bacterium]|nr:putative manganese-dependent inorganic diphosphatase [Solirubrobacteraceae bacterium]
MSRIYVTGHRNPDTDSIAAAIGYAELLRRLDPNDEYVAVRLGDCNAQTRWVLERAGVDEPEHLPHVMLRVRDVMRQDFSLAGHEVPVREVGRTMARESIDLVPIVDDDGALVGVMTERVLARRYIRESRDASSLVDAPTAIGAIVDALGGEVLVGDGDRRVAGRVWVYAMDAAWSPSGIAEGDVVVIGNREDAQRRAIETGVALLVVSNGVAPGEDVLALARGRGTTVVASPLDSYVSGRMITLAAPCRALMDADPLTVRPDDLVSDVADIVKDVHYRAAIAVGRDRCPIGLITRSDLVNPQPRRVVLVDHAEQAQSAPGIEQAEILEILDHHHIGSIETRVPVRATFDPVGSTATLVVERFRQNGMEPSRPTATLLLGAVLSDTVILNSPTTTERDRAVVEYLERVLALDARAFGREMFESGSDVADASAEEIVTRDAKEYDVGAGTLCIAQVETVGEGLLDRREELLAAMHAARERRGHVLYALMVTDILTKGTHLLVAGDTAPVERTFGVSAEDGVVDLPGVMSRKKQVAPRLMGAF